MTDTSPRAVALGYFDGLHRAHMAVLRRTLAAQERGYIPAVLLFDRPPAEVLRGTAVPRLTTEADRRARLSDMGFTLIDESFERIRALSPAAFVQGYLKKELNAAEVVCGYNYTFGAGGRGDADLLKTLCAENGIAVSVCPPLRFRGEDISASRIRRAVISGDMEEAVEMLGAPLSFTAPVFHGDGRGRGLNAPTANQFLPDGFIVPKYGVYASLVRFDGQTFPAVTNVGVRPTFHGDSLRCETHIMGFSGSLYDRPVELGLVAFLRPEQVFPDAAALSRQIEADRANALKALGGRFPTSAADLHNNSET